MGIEKYAGRVALVTGASSGMGAGVTKALLKHGINVVGLARRVEKIKAHNVKGLPGKLYPIHGDVSSEESILSAFKWIRENLSGVDILVNCAGIDAECYMTCPSTEDLKRYLDVNVLGMCLCSREALQDMQRRGVDDGFIINISSLSAHVPTHDDGLTMHTITKWSAKTLAEGLRKELINKKSNIRVGIISPGLTDTEVINVSENWKKLFGSMPALQPEDIANCVVFMLSQDLKTQVQEILVRPTAENYL